MGLIVSASRLGDFNEEWQALLRSYELSSFHMKQLADVYASLGPKLPRDRTVEQTVEALLPFAECINKHLEVGLVQVWSVDGYVSMPTEAKRRLGGSHNDPHYLAFIRGMLEAADKIPVEDSLSVVYDDDKVKAWDFYLHYRAICEPQAFPEMRKRFAALTFARDEDFPALQAADMVAFLSRAEAQAQFRGSTSDWSPLFTYLTTDPKPGKGLMRWFQMFADEAKLLALANGLQKPLTEGGYPSSEHEPLSR